MLALKVFKTMRIHVEVKGPLVSRMEGTRLLSELCNCGFPHSSGSYARGFTFSILHVQDIYSWRQGISWSERRHFEVFVVSAHLQARCAPRAEEKRKNGGPPRPSPTTSCDNEQHSFSLCRPEKKKLFLLWNSSHLWHKSVRNGGVSAAEFFPRLLNNDVLGRNAYIAPGILRCLAAPLLIIFRRIWPRFWWEAFC